MNRKTLRIKRVYFDQILSGEKTFELRSGTDFYRRMFESKVDQIMLHYQGVRKLIVDVQSIRIVKTPKGVDEKIISTAFCYQIDLTNPRLV